MSKHHKKTSFLRKLILVICAVLFLVSAGYLGWKYYQGYLNEQQYGSINRPDGSSSTPSGISKVIQEQYQDLLLQNPDTVGWLSIGGTTVDYPVVQRENDNDFYLKIDFKGNKNPYGALFVDSRADMINGSTNTVIYGHNLNNAQMFGELMKYKELEYYQSHPVISFDTLYGDGDYKIIGMFIVNAGDEDKFNYHNFVNAYAPDQTADFLKKVANRTIINTGVDVSNSDTFITLSTCTYEFNDARFAIVARKVRPGESAEVDVTKAVKNPDPLMPDIWYQTYGGTKPNLD